MTRGVEFLVKNNPFSPTQVTTKMIENDIENFLKEIDAMSEPLHEIMLLKQAKAEIERLRKDEARIDWLADRNNLDNLRAAIDETMML